MAQQNDSGFLSIVAGAVRGANLRVYNVSGTWTTADATHAGLGVQLQPSVATTDIVALKSVSAPGTVKMVANEAIAVGATVYAAADGEVATTGTIIEGIALTAATADQDVIEVVPIHNSDVSAATTGTTAATFQVDSDLGKPRAGLKSQTGGTGNFVAYYQAPATLTADRTYTGPADANDTLAGLGTAQTFTARQTFAGDVANTAGVGITGAAANFVTSVEKVGTVIKTTILIDLAGLHAGGTAGDLIGANGSGVCHLGQITAAVNGTIFAGRMKCLETPATGDDDIDLYSATEATGVEDTAISALTATQLCNSGNLTNASDIALTAVPAANKYLYLVSQTGDAAADAYTAGILLIELWGKAA
jgi:hypothetical protein